MCLVEKTKSDAVKSLFFTEYLIGTWKVRSTNVRSMVKQEMARVNISEQKWMGVSEFNSDNHYIYYCSQESGEGNSNPLQYSCLENPMDGGAWQFIVHGVPRV